LTCYWLIEAINCAACRIELTYTEFDLENSYDYVQHYSDNAFLVPVGPKYSGKTMPPVQTSTGALLGIAFVTDYNNPGGPYTGFFANWEILNYNGGLPKTYYCDGANSTALVSAGSGAVASNSASQYGNQWYCTWKVTPASTDYPSSFYSALIFRNFSVEQGFDQLRLYRDLNYGEQIESTFSSTNIPAINSANRYAASSGMSIVFQTDFSGTSTGFFADYTIVQTAPTYYCDGRTTQIDTTLTYGRISDRAGHYNSGWNCKWSVRGGPNKQVTFKFTEFNTRTSVDYVRVYNGDNYNTLMATYSGTTLPVNQVSSVGQGLSITFITPTGYPNNQYPGFTLEYKIYDLTP